MTTPPTTDALVATVREALTDLDAEYPPRIDALAALVPHA